MFVRYANFGIVFEYLVIIINFEFIESLLWFIIYIFTCVIAVAKNNSKKKFLAKLSGWANDLLIILCAMKNDRA